MRAFAISYTAICLLLVFSTWRARVGSPGFAPRWLRLAAWLAATALTAWLTWSLLGCTVLTAFDSAYDIGVPTEIAACVRIAGYWAFFPILLALPLFACLISWYTARWGNEPRGWTDALRFALGSAIAPFVGLLYGNALVDGYNGQLWEAFTAATVGFVTTAIALQLPRYIFRKLGLGQLVRTRAV